ncbi:MAG: ABC transporter permease, partial [Endomicrobium sp.]|nr:ABC transporter permease [Endomicrobium sp.]
LIVADKKTEHQKKEMPIKSEKKVSQKAFSIGRVKDYFVQAYRSLKGNKLRSLLSILGVMIGVSSLISMLAVGAGAKKSIEKEIANMGVNNLVVMPGFSQKGGISKETGAFRLKIDDIEDLKKNVKGIKTICGFYYNRAQIVANGHNHNTLLGGSSPGFQDLSDSHEPLNFGRLFTEKENIERKKVVILGETVVEKIYGDRKFNPVGKYIKINRIDFQVIGVDSTYEGRSRGDQDPDDQVVIPLNTALYRVFGTNTLKYLKLRVKDDDDMSKVSEDIITRLLFTHRVRTGSRDAVTVYNMADIQKAMASMSKSFSLLLGSIAFISLLVGGIGIMNIMFVSVSERTKEIGLRKAIGANNSDILFQFLIESVFVCCAGGVIGIIFGAGVSFIISKLAGWDAVITLFSIVLAFCFSCITGVVFGVWPARKASLLNPIEALRHD